VIKVVLFDLDDTLMTTHFAYFFARYLELLGEYGSDLAPSDVFIDRVLSTYARALQTYDPARSLQDRFLAGFSAVSGRPVDELRAFFGRFYVERYPELRSITGPRLESPALLDWLAAHDYRIVVATNPAMPEHSIIQRLRWSGLDPDVYPFELITTLETMHFGKPQPEYFEEILLRLGVSADEAIMVGDDWDDDIAGAATAGLNTFWVCVDGASPPDGSLVDGCGSFDELARRVKSGWLKTLQPRAIDCRALIHRLAAFPAAINVLRRSYSRDVLECCPGEHEWSFRDVVCHLLDHETEEDRKRLRQIVEEDNPFLSANYDPWAHAHEYANISVDEAFAQFVRERSATVDWLKALPHEVWRRPARYSILGPTYFEEMVRFTTEHDRTHLLQMHDAIAYALAVCE
jgi:HAD superfamily hydrolase (TIGR01549 family)